MIVGFDAAVVIDVGGRLARDIANYADADTIADLDEFQSTPPFGRRSELTVRPEPRGPSWDSGGCPLKLSSHGGGR